MRGAAVHAETKMRWAKLAGLAVGTAWTSQRSGLIDLTSVGTDTSWDQGVRAVVLEPFPAYLSMTQEARPSQPHKAQDGAGGSSRLEEADHGEYRSLFGNLS